MEKPNQTKEMPLGVKIISVLYFGLAAFFLIGIINIISGFLIISFILIILIFLGLAALFFFVGRGLWKGRNWSRITAIIISTIAIILTIVLMVLLYSVSKQVTDNLNEGMRSFVSIFYMHRILINGTITIVINLAIALYFMFNNKVKETFERG